MTVNDHCEQGVKGCVLSGHLPLEDLDLPSVGWTTPAAAYFNYP